MGATCTGGPKYGSAPRVPRALLWAFLTVSPGWGDDGPRLALAFPGSAWCPLPGGTSWQEPVPAARGGPAAPDSARGCPAVGCRSGLCVADADKPLLLPPGARGEGDTGAWGVWWLLLGPVRANWKQAPGGCSRRRGRE